MEVLVYEDVGGLDASMHDVGSDPLVEVGDSGGCLGRHAKPPRPGEEGRGAVVVLVQMVLQALHAHQLRHDDPLPRSLGEADKGHDVRVSDMGEWPDGGGEACASIAEDELGVEALDGD